jgi:hypothetical protein
MPKRLAVVAAFRGHGVQCPEDKESFAMNNVIKLLLATVVAGAPLFSASPASAGGHGAALRYGRVQHYGGWGGGPVAFGCLRGCGQYVARFNDCNQYRVNRFRGDRFVNVTVENNYYRIDQVPSSGGQYGGTVQVGGGKYSDKTQIGGG